MSHYFLCSQNKDSMNNRFIQILIFDFVAAEFQKTPSPKPARIHSPDPFLRAGKFSRGFAKSFSPENSFGKTESVLKPRHTARILGGQNPKKKNVLSILEKIHPAKIKRARDIFSFWGCRVKRGGDGAFVERTLRVQVTTRSARAISRDCFQNKFEFCTMNTAK